MNADPIFELHEILFSPRYCSSVGSIVFVLLYISAVTGSLFVGVMGLGQIFLAFPPAILLYRFVFGYAYFGTLNMMGMYARWLACFHGAHSR